MQSYSNTGVCLTIDGLSIRLAHRDSILLEHFMKEGLFQSKSAFIRYAIRKTINEIIFRDIRENLELDYRLKNITPRDLHKEIKQIRKKIWEEYSKDLD